MDGFDQDHAASEGDERSVILHGLLTAHGNTLEALQLADRLFDTESAFIRVLAKNFGWVLAFERYGMTGQMPRSRAALRFAAASAALAKT